MTEAEKPKGFVAGLLARYHLGWVSAVVAAVAVVWGFGANTFDVASKVCKIGGEASGLSDACGAAHLGGRPTRAERIAWATRPAHSCPALRAHLNRFPGGVHAEEAARAITARSLTYVYTWTPETRSLPLSGEGEAGTKAEAQSRALSSARRDADNRCRGFGAGTLFRYLSASPRAETWTCKPAAPGVACGFEGKADCDLQVRREVERESC